VLPEAVAQDADRLARFEREAKLLASLSHQNVATLHGLEEHEGQRFLVMELADGETLDERIKKGPIPVYDALPIALQIAQGLDAAHEQGIIHRDLKPANVMVSPEGKVKVLDFGLAKAWQPEERDADITHSPTVTAQMTTAGVLLGTAAYMSPEQARGKPVDKRADIWAFGVVLWEMITGLQPFQGDTVTDVLARILERDPEWNVLQASIPPSLRRLLHRCLDKDPRQRLHDIADARLEIEEARAGSPAEVQHPAHEPSRWRAIRMAMAACAGVVLGGLAVWGLLRPAPPTSPPVTRFTITLPEGQRLGGPAHPLAISPDGTTLAYVAESDGQRQLYVRGLSELEARPLAGTEGASNPFFSTDGQWVGFYAGSRLKKADIAGASVADLGEVPVWLSAFWGAGSAWGTDGRIVFSSGAGADGGLKEISDKGGAAGPLVRSEGTELPVWPHFLPNQRELLFTIARQGVSELVLLSLESNDKHTLLRGARGPLQATYLRTGHLVYSEADRLFAAPFDLSRYEVGTPKPVLESIHTESHMGTGITAAFALSASGTIAFVPRMTVALSELVWVDRDGGITPVNVEPGVFTHLKLSQDGTRAAVQLMKAGGSEIWLCDLQRGTLTPLTGRGLSHEPVWTPDGRWIIFSNGVALLRTSADGGGEVEELLTPENAPFPSSLSPDGRVLAFYCLAAATRRDIYVVTMDGEKTQRPILVNAVSEHTPMFSPDGGLLAYVSDRSGREEVYVQPEPGPGPRYLVSMEGGREPKWSRDGRELFYRSGDKMMVVSVETEPRFSAGLPRVLFEGRFRMGRGGGQAYDVSPDGSRFLMIRSPQERELTEIRVVLNWAEELKRLVPTEQ
jgi:Tol biopolymer transport system component